MHDMGESQVFADIHWPFHTQLPMLRTTSDAKPDPGLLWRPPAREPESSDHFAFLLTSLAMDPSAKLQNKVNV
jgi:hypothetical protein